jgi:hypothetical protein
MRSATPGSWPGRAMVLLAAERPRPRAWWPQSGSWPRRAVAMVVGQVRSAALDLLRCSGMELADAQQALDEAAGPAIEGP